MRTSAGSPVREIQKAAQAVKKTAQKPPCAKMGESLDDILREINVFGRRTPTLSSDLFLSHSGGKIGR